MLILDHHSGYIGWDQYLKNRELMAENLAQRDGEGRGAAKKRSGVVVGTVALRALWAKDAGDLQWPARSSGPLWV